MTVHVTMWKGDDERGHSFIVREATRRDAPRYLEHTRALIRETAFMLQAPEDGLPEDGEQRLILTHYARLPNCLCLVAVRPGASPGRKEILGSLTLLGGQGRRTRGVVHLGMGVRRHAWRVGMGGRLLDRAIAWARLNPLVLHVTLQVYTENTIARALYLTRGFVEEGILRREARMDGIYQDLVGMGLDVERRS